MRAIWGVRVRLLEGDKHKRAMQRPRDLSLDSCWSSRSHGHCECAFTAISPTRGGSKGRAMGMETRPGRLWTSLPPVFRSRFSPISVRANLGKHDRQTWAGGLHCPSCTPVDASMLRSIKLSRLQARSLVMAPHIIRTIDNIVFTPDMPRIDHHHGAKLQEAP
jgi:hypothetical protein